MSDRPSPESSVRDGVPCTRLRLADGRLWGLARPTWLYAPEFVLQRDLFGQPIRRVSTRTVYGYPAAIGRVVEQVEATCFGGDLTRQHEAFLTLCVALLRRAHDVSLEHACGLLTFTDENLKEVVDAVAAILTELRDAERRPDGATSSVTTDGLPTQEQSDES